MGDRTDVTIKIRTYDFEKIKVELDEEDLKAVSKEDSNESITTFHESEVNYASWDSLERVLVDNNIEYDKFWGSGSDYEAGSEYCRIIVNKKGEKEYASLESYESQDVFAAELTKFLEIKDEKKLRKALEKKLKELVPFVVTPLEKPNSQLYIEEN